MKRILVSLLIVCAVCTAALPQRNKLPETRKLIEKVIPLEIADQANDFTVNGLPVPYIIGDNRSDATAAKIAAQLSKYDEDSLSKLMAALQKAGFYIIDENQKILYQPTVDEHGMGLAFYDYEVVGMYKLSRGGTITSVASLANLIAKDFPPPDKKKFGELMLEDLRSAANLPTKTKADAAKRFWARLIIELGKQFPEPVDLLTATPEKAQLNIIQASLWQRRLVGDLIAFVSKQNENANLNRKFPGDLFRGNRSDFEFVDASFARGARLYDPCNYADEETTEIDVAATGITTIHGKILGAFVDEEIATAVTGSAGKLEKVGKGLGVASLVLSWAKLVAAVSQMHGSITVEDPMPLIRTKSGYTPGEKRLLTGKFEIKVNNLRALNCVRTTLNMTTGLDFSMPSSGPLAEKPVSWELGGEVSFAGQRSSKTGVFDQTVYLKTLDGVTEDYHRQETDANGESKIYLEGTKQRKDLSNQKVVPYPKKAVVMADIALKNMKDTKQEIADVGGMALGVATGGGLLGIFGAIPEIGFRMKLRVAAVTIPVRDWTPCSEDWGGTISVKREKKQTIVIKSTVMSNGNGTGNGIRQTSEFDQAEVTLNPRKPDEIDSKDPNPAALVLSGKHSDVSELIRDGDPCCGSDEGKYTVKYREGKEMNYSRYVKDRVNVNYRGSERDYTLSFSIEPEPENVTWREFREVSESNCPLDEESYSNEIESPYAIGFGLEDGRYGERVFNTEGELLFGTKEKTYPDGSKYTWTWALARCKQ